MKQQQQHQQRTFIVKTVNKNQIKAAACNVNFVTRRVHLSRYNITDTIFLSISRLLCLCTFSATITMLRKNKNDEYSYFSTMYEIIRYIYDAEPMRQRYCISTTHHNTKSNNKHSPYYNIRLCGRRNIKLHPFGSNVVVA